MDSHEIMLAKKASKGDQHARNQLIESMLPFAWREAHKVGFKMGYDPSELVQVAILKIVTVFNKFNPCRGIKPLTYFGKIMVREMYEHIHHDGVIRIKIGSYDKPWKTKLVEMARGVQSLDFEADGLSLGYTIEDKKTAPADVAAERKELHQKLSDLLNRMEDRLKFIILRRIEGISLREIGVDLRITKERVRQLERRAKKLLRESMAEIT